ncbi:MULTISPECIES: mandelate racemase/muconate lactonizing enzyme family protein [Rhizobiaceae]|uniref:Mandelate racemase/muconate lactonizing enzyme family protein n=2 Tax=Agrobacterium TaxID=357 RepID=A0A546XJA1_AGRTU|nr:MULTISPECIES: mandelate racemase/muconate lactonizing enzyme family protein [Rhizobiaceae]MCZ7472397.1 mandelate racemase/muconate lactonizing enzyme family protein [Rhizobium rhizogenes]MCZ7483708.1 mandelate racemase/muconate lactonizing enzyme family protein [Rhizobium rhizogenes]MCZ7934833.1 mandelate racemase/muconate lactonizing enzyme family protein [Agrobacterium leguminum]MCZ7976968.1 mandelate racemase/muconate lactonizing enzyme family protein [Agrobacterium salinitolerans]NOV192
MRVTNIRAYRIPTGGVRPVLVEVVTDEGVSGWGEAAVAYGLGARGAAGMVADYAARVIGADPNYPRHVYHAIYDNSFWTKGGGAIAFAAVSAIDQALWDIKGKAAGVPVYDFFGGRFQDTAPVYANGWNYHCNDATEWAKAAERPLKDGYKMLKSYPLATQQPGRTLTHVQRRSLSADEFKRAIDRIRLLKDVVGDQAELLIDLSGGVNNDQLVRILDVCEELKVSWVEEPLDAFNLAGLKNLAARYKFPIAAGERVYTRNGFKNLLDSGAIDVVMPDVGNCGGVFELVQIAAMAEAYNARMSPHNCASSLCTAATLQVWAACANAMDLEIYPYLPESQGYVQVLKNAPEDRIKNGLLEVGSDPGLGADVDTERLKPYCCYDYLEEAA